MHLPAVLQYTETQVKVWGEGNVMMVIGSADGIVSRMRFRVPLAPGSELDKIEVHLLTCNFIDLRYMLHSQNTDDSCSPAASLNCTTG